jgi:hypothetical protein
MNTLCVAIAAIALSLMPMTPSMARDQAIDATDLAGLCKAAHDVCLPSCNRDGSTFGGYFDQATCEMQCDANYNACLKTIPLTATTGKQSRPKIQIRN